MLKEASLESSLCPLLYQINLWKKALTFLNELAQGPKSAYRIGKVPTEAVHVTRARPPASSFELKVKGSILGGSEKGLWVNTNLSITSIPHNYRGRGLRPFAWLPNFLDTPSTSRFLHPLERHSWATKFHCWTRSASHWTATLRLKWQNWTFYWYEELYFNFKENALVLLLERTCHIVIENEIEDIWHILLLQSSLNLAMLSRDMPHLLIYFNNHK